MLSEETKWLAVTNKSFDAGRRGFNDRLAFFGMGSYSRGGRTANKLSAGKRVLELQCSLGLISVADTSHYHKAEYEDPHGREPFRHPAIESVECLLGSAHHWFTSHKQLANLAEQYGLPEVVRWHPRDVSGHVNFYRTIVNHVVARTSPSLRIRTRLCASHPLNNRRISSGTGRRSRKSDSYRKGADAAGIEEEMEAERGDPTTRRAFLMRRKEVVMYRSCV